jgi:hypothetical protein
VSVLPQSLDNLMLVVLACATSSFGAVAISATDVALRAELAVVTSDASARAEYSTLVSLTAHSTNIVTTVGISSARLAAGLVSTLHCRRAVNDPT